LDIERQLCCLGTQNAWILALEKKLWGDTANMVCFQSRTGNDFFKAVVFWTLSNQTMASVVEVLNQTVWWQP
jgi:hypothetical protein